ARPRSSAPRPRPCDRAESHPPVDRALTRPTRPTRARAPRLRPSPRGSACAARAAPTRLKTPAEPVELSGVSASKLVSLRDAIARVVPDGASVCMGTAFEAAIPFAAGHEIIRQGKRDLTLLGPISALLVDQLIGAGAARRVIAAWVGNVSAGLGHNYRRATEQGEPRPLAVADHSNLTLSLALLAGSLGVPYIPPPSLLGS